jgi:SAM-dependent methyltransferase
MNTQRRKEWFDDESFWEETYPFMFSRERFKETPDQVEKILQLVKPRGKAVLDLCCGPGRCTVALARKGFKVTGVDRSEFLLKKAKARARRSRVKIDWVKCDMRDYLEHERFDLILNMFTSFGYFDRKEEDLQVLQNIYSCLKPGGIVLIDVMGKERLASILQPTTSNLLPNGTRVVQHHEIFDDWTRIRNEWLVIRKGRSKSFTFHHTIYSGQELRDRLEQVGFHKVQLFGSLDGAAYGPQAQRLIAVARKSVH